MSKLLAILATTAFATSTAVAKNLPAEPVGPASKAVTADIIRAISEEMNRSTRELVIPNAPRPYSISYKITEVDVNDVAASLGHTTSKHNRHFVNLEARVRVGGPEFDNSNFVVPDAAEIDGAAAINLPLEATPRIAKRAAWLVTDNAYKEALIQLRAKLEARQASGNGRRDVPAWTSEKPVVSAEQILVAPLETLDDLEQRAKALSRMFRDQPAIRDSRVALTSYLERRWYLTTEGTSVSDTRRASGIIVAATGQADDGEFVRNYFARYGHTAKDLPTDKELAVETKKLSDSIIALAKAPVVQHYSGPVLFEGEGAVGVLRFSLAPHLGGTPVPEGLNPLETKQFGGLLVDSVGERVLPRGISLIDDPTTHWSGKSALIGGYKIDDEGVAAQHVEVVKNGNLRTLLTSRTPSSKDQRSNGHARRTTEGGAFHGSATNLFVIGTGGSSRQALRQKLIALARADGKKYGIVIRRFDDAAITSSPEFTRRELNQMRTTADRQVPPPATLAYRVYPDGREELVRGLQLAEVPIKAWKDILGVSTERTVYNFLSATESQLFLRLTGGTDEGFVPSGGIENSITTPDLLFRDLDCDGSTTGRRPLPRVAKPSAGSGE